MYSWDGTAERVRKGVPSRKKGLTTFDFSLVQNGAKRSNFYMGANKKRTDRKLSQNAHFPLEPFMLGVREVKTGAAGHSTSWILKEHLNFTY